MRPFNWENVCAAKGESLAPYLCRFAAEERSQEGLLLFPCVSLLSSSEPSFPYPNFKQESDTQPDVKWDQFSLFSQEMCSPRDTFGTPMGQWRDAGGTVAGKVLAGPCCYLLPSVVLCCCFYIQQNMRLHHKMGQISSAHASSGTHCAINNAKRVCEASRKINLFNHTKEMP